MGKRFAPPETPSSTLSAKLTTLSPQELSQVADLVEKLEAARRTPPSVDSAEDDLLQSLDVATENRRAQQVYEWERLRRQAQRSAAFPHLF